LAFYLAVFFKTKCAKSVKFATKGANFCLAFAFLISSFYLCPSDKSQDSGTLSSLKAWASVLLSEGMENNEPLPPPKGGASGLRM